jgi:hypothetical protein
MDQLTPEMEKIIDVANELLATGGSAASTGEIIAAAFVLNDQNFLPDDYSDIVEAWERLGERWQRHVKAIKRCHIHHIHFLPGAP